MSHLRLVKPEGPKPPRKKYQRGDPTFTPDESDRIRAALRHARTLFGTWPCLAAALYLSAAQVTRAAHGRKRITASIAVRLARALGKPLESLYRAPTSADVCPTCGARRAP